MPSLPQGRELLIAIESCGNFFQIIYLLANCFFCMGFSLNIKKSQVKCNSTLKSNSIERGKINSSKNARIICMKSPSLEFHH